MIFKHVFEPIEFCGLRMENRVLMPAMHIGQAEDGFINDGFIDFYVERAKAGPGPGIIIVGGCYSEGRGMGAPNFVAIDHDRYIPRLKEFTDCIHRHRTPVATQLYHAGRYALGIVIGEQPVSASAVPSHFTRETPRLELVKAGDRKQVGFKCGTTASRQRKITRFRGDTLGSGISESTNNS